jgi:CrcB protein
MTWLLVAAGGAVGSMARHGVNVAVHRWVGNPVPYATAVVNIVGCAVIGVLAGLVSAGALRWGMGTRVFVFVGVLGGFTTFSSLGLDTLTLAHDGAFALALRNVAAQIVLGLGAVFLGYWVAR